MQGTLLQAVSALADAPLINLADRLRDALFPYLVSSALVIFTEDCTGRPQKKAGEEEIISKVSIAEVERLRVSLSSDIPWQGEAEIAGSPRAVLALKFAPSNALLVITDPDPGAANSTVALVEYLWQMVARRIQEKVADAPPSYLLESRAASAERVRVTAELVDLHSTTLETLLAALRSPSMDDASVRSTVTDLTARTLITLRTVSDRTTDLVEEPVALAFARLHEDQWDCDGENLLINVRDDGKGALSPEATNIERLERRVQVLAGSMQIDVMAGWGADVSVTLPLDAPASSPVDVAGWNLAARELEVLQHMAAGKRNRSIASALNISENTVKFHVRNLFKKLDVRSRTEAIALAHSHGVR